MDLGVKVDTYKKSIKTKIVILLDHSSSIAPDAPDALEYKKATLD